uniref:Uncharacterized protein n=1 Tax=Megaselia scalaris TaxID=36166 RepID=T1GNK4_MEGSC
MKYVFCFLIFIALAKAIKIQKIESNGVYFKDLGYVERNFGVWNCIIQKIDDFKKGIKYKSVNNSINFLQISCFENILNSSENLKNEDIFSFENDFEKCLMNIKSNNCNNLLTLDQLRQRIQSLKISVDSGSVFNNLWKTCKISRRKTFNGKIEISLKFQILDESRFFASTLENVNLERLNREILINNFENFKGLQQRSCIVELFNNQTGKHCNYVRLSRTKEMFQNIGDYQYLFSILDGSHYSFKCPGMEHNIGSNELIENTGILKLNQGCSFRTQYTQLEAQKVDLYFQNGNVINPKAPIDSLEIYNSSTFSPIDLLRNDFDFNSSLPH